ncbi:MAG: hypothetical protein M1495_04140 [Bacteroidetes bacterium]|nr:hypothetical protein [Bacteroidota bacterium]
MKADNTMTILDQETKINELTGRNIIYGVFNSTSNSRPVSSSDNSTLLNVTVSFVDVNDTIQFINIEESNNKKKLWNSLVARTSELWDNISVKDELQFQRR